MNTDSIQESWSNADDAVGFCPRSLAHVNIYVSELERSKAFYTNVCGLNLVYNEPDINASFFSNGYSHHDVACMQISDNPLIGADGKVQNDMKRGGAPGLNHLGFEVASESALIASFKKARRTASAGLVKCLDHGISHSVYLHDPDENLVEFYIDAVEDWRRYYREGNDELITSQWDPLGAEPLQEITPLRSVDKVERAPLSPARLSRATLIVTDFDKLLRYYTEIAGMRVMTIDADERVAILAGSGDRYSLALVELRDRERAGLHCFGFDLGGEPDVDSALQELAALGAANLRSVDGPFKTSLSFQDPDGFNIEFYRSAPLVDPARPPRREDVLVSA